MCLSLSFSWIVLQTLTEDEEQGRRRWRKRQMKEKKLSFFLRNLAAKLAFFGHVICNISRVIFHLIFKTIL